MSRQETDTGSSPAPAESEAAPRDDDDSLIRVTGTVKWFDATRGFGFIVSDDVKGDILVHFSVLKEHDRRSLPEGAVIECLVAEQERGLRPERCSASTSARRWFPSSAAMQPPMPTGSILPPCSVKPVRSSWCG